MADDQNNDNQNHDKKRDWLQELLRAIAIIVAVLLLLAIVGFGLIVGFCALGR
jgi:hypothetical protein